jgi:uncharacterized protein (TIGR02246 family)
MPEPVQETMVLTKEQEAEVAAVMQRYAAAYVQKDFRAMIAIFSRDINGYGSGADEVIRDHESFIRQIRRDLGQATVNRMEFSDTKISGEGRIAWVRTRQAITFTVPGEAGQTLDGRTTMVLHNTGSRWLIGQIHFSMPYGGQSAGQSFPGA